MFSFLKKSFSLFKKVLLVVIVYFAVITAFVYFINKDKPKITYDPIQRNRQEIYKIINNKTYSSTKQGKLTTGFYRLLICGMTGEACTNNPADGDKNFNKSALGFISNLISLPFINPPASGVYWAYSSLQNAGFVPKTYAAEGIGFAAIKPFIKIWTAFRNMAFIVLVLILISIGFMIMFRMKINPQTVISIENSLPKIVVALLLITFSYAIAGFLIDLMYVMILIIISVLSTTNVDKYTPANTYSIVNEYVGAGLGKLYPVKFNLITTGNYLISIFPSALSSILKIVGGWLAAFGIAKWIFKDVGAESTYKGFNNIMIQAATFGFGTGETIGHFFGIIIYWAFTLIVIMPIALPLVIGFLIFLTVILLMIRIFFLLLTTYIQNLFLIFFAPIILIFEAIPGKNTFSWWFKNLFANLITFPLIVLIIITSDIIVKTNAQVGTNQFWAPPFLYPLNQDAMTILLGLGIYLMLPDLIKMAKEAMGVKGMPLNLGVGTFFGGATAVTGGLMSGAGQFGSISLALGALGPSGAFAKIGSKIPGIQRLWPQTEWKKLEEKNAS